MSIISGSHRLACSGAPGSRVKALSLLLLAVSGREGEVFARVVGAD